MSDNSLLPIKKKITNYQRCMIINSLILLLILGLASSSIAISVFNRTTVDNIVSENRAAFPSYINETLPFFLNYIQQLIIDDNVTSDEKLTILQYITSTFGTIQDNVTNFNDDVIDLSESVITLIDKYNDINNDALLSMDNLITINGTGTQITLTNASHGHVILFLNGSSNNTIFIPPLVGLSIRISITATSGIVPNQIIGLNITQIFKGYIRDVSNIISFPTNIETGLKIPCLQSSEGDTVEILVLSPNIIYAHGEIHTHGDGIQWRDLC
jgi:hypothetical protein